MEGFAALLAGLAQKSKYALDLVVLGFSTPLRDDGTRSALAVVEGNPLRDPFRETSDWKLDSPELNDIRFNPATGLLMLIDEIDMAGNPEGSRSDDDSAYFG